MSRLAGVMVAGLLVLGTACGSVRGVATASPIATQGGSSPSIAPTTTSPSAAPSPGPIEGDIGFLRPASGPTATTLAQITGIKCTGNVDMYDSVAIVQMRDGTKVLRDYRSVAAPYTVCQFPAELNDMRLVDATHDLIGLGNSLYAIVDVPTLHVRWFQLPGPSYPTFLAISPTLDEVAYLTQDFDRNVDDLHLASTAGDRVVASLSNPHAGRCGSVEDSHPGGYSQYDHNLYVLDQPVPPLNSLLILHNGQPQLKVVPSGQWTAGSQPAFVVPKLGADGFFYRLGSDVWNWTANGPETAPYLRGVQWYYPTMSSDGEHLAYAIARSDGLHDVYLLNTVGFSTPKLIGRSRTMPVFLNSRQLWYERDTTGGGR